MVRRNDGSKHLAVTFQPRNVRGPRLSALLGLLCALSVSSVALARAQPRAARPAHGAASCGSDSAAKKAARREAYLAKREEAKQRREAAAAERREKAQAKREAYLAKREEAKSAAAERREEAKSAAAERREAARAKAEERREAALAKRAEAKQRREAAAEERREKLAARAEAKRAQADDAEADDADVDDDSGSLASGGGSGPGTLRVNSRPWAQVYVDGKMVGHTPQLGISVQPGEHQVRLVNPMFAMSKAFKLKVRGGQRITRVETLEE